MNEQQTRAESLRRTSNFLAYLPGIASIPLLVSILFDINLGTQAGLPGLIYSEIIFMFLGLGAMPIVLAICLFHLFKNPRLVWTKQIQWAFAAASCTIPATAGAVAQWLQQPSTGLDDTVGLASNSPMIIAAILYAYFLIKLQRINRGSKAND